jgi:hypothetical protein
LHGEDATNITINQKQAIDGNFQINTDDIEDTPQNRFTSDAEKEAIAESLNSKLPATTLIPAKTSDIVNDSGFITKSVNDLVNYYLKADVYTKAEVASLISALTTINILRVETLPTENISTTTIYLVPNSQTEGNNLHDEYIYVNNKWECIGNTSIDLTNYATKEFVANALSLKVDNGRVLTDVPLNAIFTDTITKINGKTGEITKEDIIALGIPAQDTVQDLTILVPYTGATKDVDLSNSKLTAKELQTQKEAGNLYTARRINDSFDSVQHFVAPSTYTNDTTLVSTGGNMTGDVLNVVNDFLYIGKLEKFSSIFFDFYTIMSIGTNRTWEYLAEGNVWTAFTPVSDGTNEWQQDGIVEFTPPDDWATGIVNSVADMYWIRVGTASGAFSTEPTLRLCLPVTEIPTNVIEIYALEKDTLPSLVVDKNGGVAIGYADAATYRVRIAGSLYATSISTGTISGSTGAFSGAVTQTLTTTGQTHVGGFIANGPVATALLPSQNSPVIRFSGQAWNGLVTKINAMDIYVNPNADPITNARMAFKNTTIDGYADANEVMNISSNGKLNVLGTAQHPLDRFDRIFHFLAPSTYTDDTLLLNTLGSVTTDVLNVVGDYLYIGKRLPFTEMYFEFQTIMSAGTVRKWEYSKGNAVWEALPITSDGTSNWSKTGSVLFEAPADWGIDTVNATPDLYWVRVGTVSGTFSVEPTLRFLFPNTKFIDEQVLSNNEFDDASMWETTGDWAYSTLDHTFTFNTGEGTLKQPKESFHTPAKPNTWYRLRYTVGVAAPSTTVAWIGEEFSDGKTYFTGSTNEVDVFFKTNSDPQDFVIHTTATATSGFRLDAVSLLPMTQGDILATGNIVGANLSGTNTGDETALTIKDKLGITTLSGANTGNQDLTPYAKTVDIPTKLSGLENDKNFIDNLVTNLTNYYLKTETYTKVEINTLLGNISGLQIEIVTNGILPETGNANTIYLVPKTGSTNDVYIEYMYINSQWEIIGSTAVDLTNYLQKAGDGSNITITFVTAAERANIASGEDLSVLLGKIQKWFNDLKTVSLTGSFKDLVDAPAISDPQTIYNGIYNFMQTSNCTTVTEVFKTANYAKGSFSNLEISANGRPILKAGKTYKFTVIPVWFTFTGITSVAYADLLAGSTEIGLAEFVPTSRTQHSLAQRGTYHTWKPETDVELKVVNGTFDNTASIAITSWQVDVMIEEILMSTSIVNETVDTAMSETSENSVQNKVIKEYVDGLVGDVETLLANL